MFILDRTDEIIQNSNKQKLGQEHPHRSEGEEGGMHSEKRTQQRLKRAAVNDEHVVFSSLSEIAYAFVAEALAAHAQDCCGAIRMAVEKRRTIKAVQEKEKGNSVS